jgi:hypothetical protein
MCCCETAHPKIEVNRRLSPQQSKRQVPLSSLLQQRVRRIIPQEPREGRAIRSGSTRFGPKYRVGFLTGVCMQTCLRAFNVQDRRSQIYREANQHSTARSRLPKGFVVFSHVHRVRKIVSTTQESAGLSVSKWAWSRSILEAWQYRYWVVGQDPTRGLPQGLDPQQGGLERINARQREVLEQFRLALRR